MHIFADLRPYICTFADCEDKLAQFPNRAAWAEHEFSQHRITQSWSCPKCPRAFISVSGWQSHIQEKHCLFFSGHQCNVAKDMAYRTKATRIEDEECPLCRIVVGKPRRAFIKHVGRHMEEIALMALPRDVEEDSEEDCLSTDRTSSDEGTTISHAQPSIRTEEVLQYTKAPLGGSPISFTYENDNQLFSESHGLMCVPPPEIFLCCYMSGMADPITPPARTHDPSCPILSTLRQTRYQRKLAVTRRRRALNLKPPSLQHRPTPAPKHLQS